MKIQRWFIVIMVMAIAVPLFIASCTTIDEDSPVAGFPPVIVSLQGDQERVFPSESIQFVCTALDPDGDQLTYQWSASAGTVDGEGAMITWTAPESEGLYNIRVTVTDASDEEATTHVTITVKANQAPIINSLTADADWTLPSSSLEVLCDAEDPDGHFLSYEWSTSAGQIEATDHQAIWNAPQEVGIYEIAVIVRDDYGGSATKSLPISVMTDQPPDIIKLEVTKDRYDHCYLLEYPWGYKVGREQKYDIECIVSDTGVELFYEWSCDAGEIFDMSEDGSLITWIAPDTSVYLTVTVTVTNVVTGNSASKAVDLDVVACSPCTFGSCG
ncbi:MAG: PKD domain-containing protein [Dehalococcoidia bacterium]